MLGYISNYKQNLNSRMYQNCLLDVQILYITTIINIFKRMKFR